MSGFGLADYGEMPYGEQQTDDTFAPLIINFAPASGDVVGRLDTIEFDVTDDSEVASVLVNAIFQFGVTEPVFDETRGFAEIYRRGSARIQILNGYHYVLRRTTGWPGAAVVIQVTASDLAGNVGRVQS
jgi:hypothetical protein